MMQAGHKHGDLSAEGNALQHVAAESGMDYEERSAGGEHGFQRFMLIGYTKM